MKDWKCAQCGNTDLVDDPLSGEKVCDQCGLVVMGTALDMGPERRAFNPEEKAERARTGTPMSYTRYDKGLYTTFKPNIDAHGRRLDPKTRRRMWRLRSYDNRSKLDASGMRNLSKAMNELERLADRLHLPESANERAAVIYRRVLRRDMIKGRTISGFVAASVYAACRLAGIPRTLSEVAEASTKEGKDIARTYRYLVSELNLKMPVDYPMKFVPRIAEQLHISREADRLSVRILREAKRERALTGKDPRGMAAAALYLACKTNDERVTQKDIAWAAGTTEVTLRNRLRDLERVVEQADELDRLAR